MRTFPPPAAIESPQPATSVVHEQKVCSPSSLFLPGLRKTLQTLHNCPCICTGLYWVTCQIKYNYMEYANCAKIGQKEMTREDCISPQMFN